MAFRDKPRTPWQSREPRDLPFPKQRDDPTGERYPGLNMPFAWGSRYNDAVRLMPFGADELQVHVRNKIKMLDYEIARGETVFGRLLGRFSRPDLDHIELDGVAVAKLFEILGEPVPEGLDVTATYRIPHRDLRDLYERAFPDGAA